MFGKSKSSPYKEHSYVKTKVELRDAERVVPAGTKAAIVHVYPKSAGEPQAYTIEVQILNAEGLQTGMILLDVPESQIEPIN